MCLTITNNDLIENDRAISLKSNFIMNFITDYHDGIGASKSAFIRARSIKTIFLNESL